MTDAQQKKLVVCQACRAKFLVAKFDPLKRYKCKSCGAAIMGDEEAKAAAPEPTATSAATVAAGGGGARAKNPIRRTIRDDFSQLTPPSRQNQPPTYDDGFPDSFANSPIPENLQFPATRRVSPGSDSGNDLGANLGSDTAENLTDEMASNGTDSDLLEGDDEREVAVEMAGDDDFGSSALGRVPAQFRHSRPGEDLPPAANIAASFDLFDSNNGPITMFNAQRDADAGADAEMDAALEELMGEDVDFSLDPVMATQNDVSMLDVGEGGDAAASMPPSAAQVYGSVLEQLGLEEDAGVELHHPRDEFASPSQGRKKQGFAVHGSAKRYDLFGEIARGGMGAIVRARDIDLRRDVALKVMLGEKTRDRQIRFIEEAQITGQLEHPNIIPIHDLGVDGSGRLFFSMKLIRGRSLADLLDELEEFRRSGAVMTDDADDDADDDAANVRRSANRHQRFRKGISHNRTSKVRRTGGEPRTKRLPLWSLTQRLQVFLKICDAIAFSHSKGVIHRDLKPENIMVGEFGEVQVMDWGLAKVLGRKDDFRRDALVVTDRSEKNVLTTLEGTVAGTPAYMPPEQARGEIDKLDERSDVYSLGAILFELLSLEPPFVDDDVQRVLRDVKAGRITAPSERAPDLNVPRELDGVVLTAMAYRPAQRYQSVPEIKADIEAYLDGKVLKGVKYSSWDLMKKWAYANRVGVGAAAAALMMMIAGVFFTMILQQQWREQEINDLIAAGETAMKDGEPEKAQETFFKVLGLRGADDPEVRQKAQRATVAAEAQNRRHQAQTELVAARKVLTENPIENLDEAARIPVLFDALRLLNIAYGLAPDDEAILLLKREINLKLGDAALETADYTLAQHCYLEAGRTGLSPREVDKLVDRVRNARDSVVEQQRNEVQRLLAELRRPLDARTLQTTRDRILTMPGAHTVKLLLASVGSRFPLERLVAVQCLGKLGDNATVDDLGRTVADVLMDALRNLDPLQDEEFAVGLIWALADLQCGDALELIDRKRHSARSDSMVWLRTEEAFRKLPFPENLLDGKPNAPRTAEGFFQRGMLRQARREYGDAERDFSLAIQRGFGAEAYARRGEARLKLGAVDPDMIDGGLDDLRNAMQLEPNNPLRYVAVGNALNKLERHDEAERVFSNALNVSRNFVSALIGRGESRIGLKKLDAAETDFADAAKIDPASAHARLGLGRVKDRQENYHDAEDYFSQALRLDQGFVEAYVARAMVYAQLSRLPLARADVQTALRLDPRNADAYLARAALQMAYGHFESALIDCEFADQIDPENGTTWQYRIAIDFYQNDMASAQQRAETAMVEYPRQSEAFYWAGIIAAFQMRRQQSYDYFDTAIRMDPEKWQLYLQYSTFLYRDGEFERAATLLNTAEKLIPREYYGLISFMNFAMQYAQVMRQAMQNMNMEATWNEFTNHYIRAQFYTSWSLPGARRAAEMAADEYTRAFDALKDSGMPQIFLFQMRMEILRLRGVAYKRAGKPWLAIRDYEEFLSMASRMGGAQLDADSAIALAEAYADLIYAHRANDPPVPADAPSAAYATEAAINILERARKAGATPQDLRDVRAFDVLKDDPRFIRLLEGGR